MIDEITTDRIIIFDEGRGAPYFMVPDAQLAAAVAALERHGIYHWVDDFTIALDGDPAVAWVNLGRGADVAAVQRVLDSV